MGQAYNPADGHPCIARDTRRRASAGGVMADRGGFGALGHTGYRIYFIGMLLRGTAVWMQLVSVPWLAVELGADPAELGVIVGLQFLPTLFISPFGGVLADRMERGKVLFATQVGSFLQGLVLFLAVISGVVTIPVLAVFAVTFGMLTAIELPVRQSYLVGLVPRELITSAVSLHSSAWNTTRFIGPAIAGVIIATAGVAASFLVSGFVALAVTVSVVLMERYREHRTVPARATEGILDSLLAGARFAASEPSIRWALVLVTAGGMLGIQSFQTLAPLYVSDSLGLGGGSYGAFMALWGGGAVVASYVVTMAAQGDRRRWLVSGAVGMSLILLAISATTDVPVAFALVTILGFAQISLAQNAMVTVQVAAPDALRGRVMGLYTTLFQGTTPAGAFLAGWIASVAGIRISLATMAGLLGLVALAGAVALLRRRVPAPLHGGPGPVGPR